MKTVDIRNRWIRPEILEFSKYQVADAGGMVKLDAMENPYPWPVELREEWADVLKHCAVNRYPDPDAGKLKAKLQRVFGLPRHAGLVLGNGSDELIQILLLATAVPGAVLVAPEPSFVMYHVSARIAGVEYKGLPLTRGDFSLDVDAMLEVIDKSDPVVVFIPWPNNPTGNLFLQEGIERIIERARGLVVIDEAYHAFSGCSLLDRLESHENLLIMRTVSKLGLAGLRLGFLVGAPGLIGEIDKLRLPYNIGTLVQETAAFVLDHIEFLESQCADICRQRDVLYAGLSGLDGVAVWPSAANFLLFRTNHVSAQLVHKKLQEKHVLIRCLHAVHPFLENCLRVSVGTPEQNEMFLSSLKQTLSA